MTRYILILVCLAVIGLSTLTAQRRPPRIGITGQIGLLPTFLQDNTRQSFLPVAVAIDYRLAPQFSIGFLGGFSSSTSESQPLPAFPVFAFRHDYQLWLLRPTVHSSFRKTWEVYGGLQVGWTNSTIDYEVIQGDLNSKPVEAIIPRPREGFFATAFIGTRYRLGKHWGIVGELGLGVSLLTTGINYRW